ncbi:Hypothetical protein (plasmid) [Pseudomonas putida]|nr:Hypothetical protein [Pseudomonas putida]
MFALILSLFHGRFYGRGDKKRGWRLFRSTKEAGLGARGEYPATQGYRVAGH